MSVHRRERADHGLAQLRFYWVVLACGGVIMALEILSSRILAPAFGSSVYVWGSIISVFLASLSLGYFLGGYLADRDPRLSGLGRVVSLAALSLGLLALIAVPTTRWLGDLTGGSSWGTLLAATVLFGLPSVLLATVSPYAVRLAARDLEHLGHTTGRLYAVSTFGSLGGTLLSTFVFIPFFDLRANLALLLGITAATALICLAGSWRREALAVTLAGMLIALALFQGATLEELPQGLLYERVTPYQTLRVWESRGVRFLESNRVRQSAVFVADSEPALAYTRLASAALLLQPDLEKVLVLGMGSGSAGRFLKDRVPGVEVDYVDIDPAVPEIAERFLGFQSDSSSTVSIADGRRFLDGTEKRWDYIFGDTYVGLSVPFHMTTTEYLAVVKERLAPGGVFGINLASGLRATFPKAIYRTLGERFEHLYAFRPPKNANAILLATDAGVRLSREELMARGRDLDARYDFEPSLEEMASYLLAVEVDLAGVPLLSDDFAPVQRLIRLDGPPPDPELNGIGAAEPDQGESGTGDSG
jgi:spermidine synthase